MKKFLISLLIVGVFFLLFLFISFVSSGNKEEKESSLGEKTPKKKISFVWKIGGDSEADVGKNFLRVKARGSYPKDEAVTQTQAEELALRTARHLAYEKIAESIAGIRVVSNVTYKELFPEEEKLVTEVKALIKGGTIEKEELTKDKEGNPVGIVTLRIPLYDKEKGFFTRLISLIRKGEIGIKMEGFSSSFVREKTEEKNLSKVEESKEDVKKEVSPNQNKEKKPQKTFSYTGVIFTSYSRIDNLSAFPKILDKDGNPVVNFMTDIPYEMYEKGLPVALQLKDPLVKKKVGRYPMNLLLTTSPDFSGDFVVEKSFSKEEKEIIYSLVSQGKFVFLVKGGGQ